VISVSHQRWVVRPKKNTPSAGNGVHTERG
jgi:hypothetical protein